MESVGVALVGLGAIGLEAHLPAILRSPRARLLAVADSSPSRLALIDLPGEVRRATSLGEVLEDADVQLVVLATPPWATPELTMTAVRAGRFVLAEKPVATSTEHAQVYDSLTEGERGRIQVGLTYRNDPAMEHLRTLIADGVLGGPLLVRAHIYDERHDPADEQHSRLITTTLAHGSPVIHEGAHVLDWMSYLLGCEPTIEDAWAVSTRDGLAAPNLVGARARYGAVATVLMEFGWFTEALPPCELTFLGDRGFAVLDCRTFSLRITTSAGTEEVEFPGDRMERSFDLQLDRAVSLALGTSPAPHPSLDDGRAALQLSEEIATEAARVEMRHA